MTHPFQKAGLGTAPFRCTHVTEAVFTLPDGTSKAGGCCDYCYTGIRWEFHVESADQRTFKVGCDCVAKTGWGIDGFDKIRRENARARRQAGAQKRREARQAQIAAERAARAAERIEATQVWRDANAAVVARLTAYAGANDFLRSMAASLVQWGSLTQRQLDAVVSCFTSMDRAEAARTNSQHVANVGDKVTLTVTVDKVISLPRMFYGQAPTYITIGRDEQGNVIVYKGTVDLGGKDDVSTVKCSIKEHSLYNGIKQTVIQRPKVVA
jgi:hypothetical protein